MVMTDPIADMLTRIRNANMVRHEKLEMPASTIKREVAEILKREGSSAMLNISRTANKVRSAYSLSTAQATNASSLDSNVSRNQVFAFTRKLMKSRKYSVVSESLSFQHLKVL